VVGLGAGATVVGVSDSPGSVDGVVGPGVFPVVDLAAFGFVVGVVSLPPVSGSDLGAVVPTELGVAPLPADTVRPDGEPSLAPVVAPVPVSTTNWS
jgi:hypothetical protein